MQTDTPEALYRRPVSDQVARALGPVHRVKVQSLPDAWRSALGDATGTVHYRPEAIRIGEGVPLTILRTRLAGATTEIELQLSETETIFAATQPSRALRSGETVQASLDAELVFDFNK